MSDQEADPSRCCSNPYPQPTRRNVEPKKALAAFGSKVGHDKAFLDMWVRSYTAGSSDRKRLRMCQRDVNSDIPCGSMEEEISPTSQVFKARYYNAEQHILTAMFRQDGKTFDLINNFILPPPSENQAFCTVSALEGGFVQGPTAFWVDPDPGELVVSPILCFLIRHSTRPETFVFDLGVHRDWAKYMPQLAEQMGQVGGDMRVPQNVVESLLKGGLNPADVSYVCISHIYIDHVGDPTPFSNAKVIVGAGVLDQVLRGHSDERVDYLDLSRAPPIGPFEHAHDFYGDGSLYIVDATGHLPGHVNILARTSADGGWILLAADSAHDWRIIRGEAKVARKPICVHSDVERAEAHIRNIAKLLEQNKRAKVILTHDIPWYEENKGGDAFWPGEIPSFLSTFAESCRITNPKSLNSCPEPPRVRPTDPVQHLQSGFYHQPESQGKLEAIRVANMPPRKKAKTAERQTTIADHWPGVPPAGPSDKAEDVQVMARRRGRRRKNPWLTDLPNLPIDVLIEIFGCLHPKDLLSFVRSCKDFCRFLLHPKHDFIWRKAREQVEGMPDCPPFLSERAYAHVAFSWYCHGCAKKNIPDVFWPWFARYCSTCLPDVRYGRKTVIAPLKEIDKSLTRDDGHCKLFNVVNPTEGSNSAKCNQFQRVQVEQFAREWAEAKTKEARNELLKKQRALVKERNDHAKLCAKWYSKKTIDRYIVLERVRLERLWDTIDKLKVEGWGPEIEWLDKSRAYYLDSRPDIWQATKLTDRAFQKILARLLPELEEWRKDRLAGKPAPSAIYYRSPTQRYRF
ncbi:hypothetical protein C8T65DRAFT_772641 [Cerioporus squamosus]|nr:hypothetical protein C8T65DRAFT_772641 [Cerioporus squamosus]